MWSVSVIDSASDVLIGLLILVGVFWLRRRLRREKRYYGQTFDENPSESAAEARVHASDPKEEDTKMTRVDRVYAIVFLCIWLPFWTVGCLFAFQEWQQLSYGDEGFIFMSIWLAAAIPGWFFGAWMFIRLLRGDDINMTMDGDADGGD